MIEKIFVMVRVDHETNHGDLFSLSGFYATEEEAVAEVARVTACAEEDGEGYIYDGVVYPGHAYIPVSDSIMHPMWGRESDQWKRPKVG